MIKVVWSLSAIPNEPTHLVVVNLVDTGPDEVDTRIEQVEFVALPVTLSLRLFVEVVELSRAHEIREPRLDNQTTLQSGSVLLHKYSCLPSTHRTVILRRICFWRPSICQPLRHRKQHSLQT